MSHRIIISSAVAPVFQEQDVRAKLTQTQLTRVDEICSSEDPCDEDFRYLARRLTQVYCTED